jgi:hypothetical protein
MLVICPRRQALFGSSRTVREAGIDLNGYVASTAVMEAAAEDD